MDSDQLTQLKLVVTRQYEDIIKNSAQNFRESISNPDLLDLVDDLILEKRNIDIRSGLKDKVPGHLLALRDHILLKIKEEKPKISEDVKAKLKPWPNEKPEEYTKRTGNIHPRIAQAMEEAIASEPALANKTPSPKAA